MWMNHSAAIVDDFLQTIQLLRKLGYIEWKRQAWSRQLGHGFSGDDILDRGRSRTWATAEVVAQTACGSGLKTHRMGHACDFYARKSRPPVPDG